MDVDSHMDASGIDSLYPCRVRPALTMSAERSNKSLGSPGTSAPWIHRATQGTASASDWQALYERYRNPLTVYAARLCGPELARRVEPEDVVQHAWMQVFQRIDEFEYRGRNSMLGWLRLQVRRRLAELARHPARALLDPLESVREPADAGPTPVSKLHRSETRERLLRALESLPATYRDVVAARYLEGRAVITIARAFGRKPDTVSQQIRRGVALWQKALGEDPRRALSA